MSSKPVALLTDQVVVSAMVLMSSVIIQLLPPQIINKPFTRDTSRLVFLCFKISQSEVFCSIVWSSVTAYWCVHVIIGKITGHWLFKFMGLNFGMRFQSMYAERKTTPSTSMPLKLLLKKYFWPSFYVYKCLFILKL